jgi:fructose-specific phosphotransferase system IIA component
MNVRTFMHEDLVLLDLTVDNKMNLLLRLADKLTETQRVQNKEELLKLLLEREQVMTTGIGKGFAIPHTFIDDAKETFVLYSRLKEGLDYNSLDKKPVKHVFLLVGPLHAQGSHLRMLAKLSRLMNKDEFGQLLLEAETPAEVLDTVEKEETKFSIHPTNS